MEGSAAPNANAGFVAGAVEVPTGVAAEGWPKTLLVPVDAVAGAAPNLNPLVSDSGLLAPEVVELPKLNACDGAAAAGLAASVADAEGVDPNLNIPLDEVLPASVDVVAGFVEAVDEVVAPNLNPVDAAGCFSPVADAPKVNPVDAAVVAGAASAGFDWFGSVD